MFERFTESARRLLFFSRYSASELGSSSIEAEHLLLGLIREPRGVAGRVLEHFHVPIDDIRSEIQAKAVVRQKVPTSVEIPFSAASKRILQYAAAEADSFQHQHIGTEHLLLGLLREEQSLPATLLSAHGLRLDDARNHIVSLLDPESGSTVDHVEHIRDLFERLRMTSLGSGAAPELFDQISRQLEKLRARLGN